MEHIDLPSLMILAGNVHACTVCAPHLLVLPLKWLPASHMYHIVSHTFMIRFIPDLTWECNQLWISLKPQACIKEFSCSFKLGWPNSHTAAVTALLRAFIAQNCTCTCLQWYNEDVSRTLCAILTAATDHNLWLSKKCPWPRDHTAKLPVPSDCDKNLPWLRAGKYRKPNLHPLHMESQLWV